MRPLSSGKISLTGKHCLPKFGQNYCKIRKQGMLGYFMIATCSQQPSIFLCHGLKRYVLYAKESWRGMNSVWHLEEIQIPPKFVFAGHRYF